MLATDDSAEAVRLTASRCAGLPGVAVGRIRQPGRPRRVRRWVRPDRVAEFAYYLSTADRAGMWRAVDAASGRTAELVVVHWRHRPHDGYLSGTDVNVEAVQALTTRAAGWFSAVRHDDREFVLDVLLREQG